MTNDAKERSDVGTGRPRAAERILDTASDLFYREGIRAVGVDEIVARAGVTKNSVAISAMTSAAASTQGLKK